ncbi:MAG: hypothetical protein JWO03_665 [Bacteroidetes bacterium]|nr:hypothetical protein [Bacteroidota bacterium]
MKVCARILLITVCIAFTAVRVSAQNKPLLKAEQKLIELYTGIFEDASKLKTPKQKKLFLDSLEPVLEKNFLSVLSLAGAQDYAFTNLKKKVRLTASQDGRLRFFSWNTGLGDTMNFIQIVAQYKDEEGGSHLKLLKSISKENKFDQAVDYWEIDGLADSSYIAFGDGKYSTHERAISVTSFKINGEELIDSLPIFEVEGGAAPMVMVRYSIQVCGADELDVTFDPDTRTLCYPVMMMIAKDKNIGWCASGENICLLYDGSIFRRKAEAK